LSKKFVISASPVGAWRSPAAKLPRCAPAFGKTFSERASAPCDLTSVFFSITDRAHCGVVFSLDAIIPRGRTQFIIEARSREGPWETFFIHPVRASDFPEELDNGLEMVGDYALWIRRYDRLQQDDVRRVREQIAHFRDSPLISVLLPVYNSNLKWAPTRYSIGAKAVVPALGALASPDDASTERKLWPLLQKLRASGFAHLKWCAAHGTDTSQRHRTTR